MSDEIAVLIVNNDSKVNKRDVVISKRNSNDEFPHLFINENMSFYDPLSYPLMHMDGQPGWQYNTIKRLSKKDLLIEFELTQQNGDNFHRINTNNLETNLPSSDFDLNNLIHSDNTFPETVANDDFLDFDLNQSQEELDEQYDISGNNVSIEGENVSKSKYVTCREYYAYKLMERTSK
jgi:hypothetical protein